jgi:hypothetical protein
LCRASLCRAGLCRASLCRAGLCRAAPHRKTPGRPACCFCATHMIRRWVDERRLVCRAQRRTPCHALYRRMPAAPPPAGAEPPRVSVNGRYWRVGPGAAEREVGY